MVTDVAPQEIQGQGFRVEKFRAWAAAATLGEAMHPNVRLD
jgi:hypothetical protein